jgi:ATP-dependent helicase/nuclease subunit B
VPEPCDTLLLAPTVNWAREYLTALARETGGWVGWRALTLRGLAEELSLAAVAGNLGVAGDVRLAALVDQALDELLQAGKLDRELRPLARRAGFRRALTDTVLELRTAGTSPEAVVEQARTGSPAHAAGLVLARYTELLAQHHLTDPAGLFTLALERFEEEARFVLPDEVLIAPTLQPRGLPLRLLERVRAWGAKDLSSSHPAIQPPTLDFFSAATPHDEVREALRRTAAEGLRWDEVELVTTDPDAYGTALDAVARQLGIATTALHGVPWTRTRVGRLVATWFAWLEEGLPADPIRGLLDARAFNHDGAAPDTRLFRTLQVGWGRARYEAAIETLEARGHSKGLRRAEEESDEDLATRREDLRVREDILATLLRRLLATTPATPERGAAADPETTTLELARHTRGFLDLLATDEQEQRIVTRLHTRLADLEALPNHRVPFGHALAELRAALADLRAWTDSAPGAKPWRSSGGRPHLTDLAHAGTTDRPRTFVLGLDADRAAGPRLPDPILPDLLRSRLGLPATADRRREQRRKLDQALDGLCGRAAASYARAADAGGRDAGPAPALLSLWRRTTGNPAGTYRELAAALGDPASPVPTAPAGALDRRDAWLAALAEGGVLRDGRRLVRTVHPGLHRGLEAAAAWIDGAPGPHHGIIATAAGLLDPRADGRRPISPTALETLAKCPLSWFYRYGIGLELPDDPEYDAEAWLDARQRGSLLHSLFERFGKRWRDRIGELDSDQARADLYALLDELVAEYRALVPPPSELVLEAEAAELRWVAESFLHDEREERRRSPGRSWLAFEQRFGWGENAVRYSLFEGASIPVHGFIDRVDSLPGGGLVVLDYKTGSPWAHRKDPNLGPFRGGRSLQPAIYASGAAKVLGREVAAFEYRFPGQKGRNEVVRYSATELEPAAGTIASLLAQVEKGTFVPTDDPGDCKFCDFRANCRVTDPRFPMSPPVSPRAAWAKETGGAHEAYAPMHGRRAKP